MMMAGTFSGDAKVSRSWRWLGGSCVNPLLIKSDQGSGEQAAAQGTLVEMHGDC